MSRVHDIGGQTGFGPVPVGQGDGPPFAADWEARVYALARRDRDADRRERRGVSYDRGTKVLVRAGDLPATRTRRLEERLIAAGLTSDEKIDAFLTGLYRSASPVNGARMTARHGAAVDPPRCCLSTALPVWVIMW